MFTLYCVLAGALTFMALILAQIIQAQSTSTGGKRIVLIHGAFADGSGWSPGKVAAFIAEAAKKVNPQ